MSIKEKIDILYEYYNVKNDNQLANKLGYKSNSAISNWRKENKIPDKYSEIIAKYSLDTNINNKDGYWIPKISHNPSAGTKTDIDGIEVFDSEYEKIFLPTTFFKTQMNEEDLRFFQVEGDSMFPKLRSGDWVVMKLAKEFTGDAMYVINYGNALMVKTLQIKPNGNLFIKSLNPEYESYEITQDSQNIFYIIGKVLRTIS